jgi:hypothetical protein
MREPIQRLLTEGAAIERRLQQQIDDSRRGRSVADDIAAVAGLLREWGPAVSRFIREVLRSHLAPAQQQPILRASKDLAARIGQLHDTVTSAQAP